ncbi:uncharacterized protein G2W53_036266 [Senna tora]|uniref:Uncharacterized protein n=1 Tax=Senna tora TaxID=362788 RepID=A0A834W5T3_9FABA|nr:uncharacterized protein G2W53_036266 [Senna tora]
MDEKRKLCARRQSWRQRGAGSRLASTESETAVKPCMYLWCFRRVLLRSQAASALATSAGGDWHLSVQFILTPVKLVIVDSHGVSSLPHRIGLSLDMI